MFTLCITDTGRGFVAPTVVRLRLAAPSVFGDGEYAFLHETSAGQPMTFNTCGPLRVVINEASRPIDAVGLVEEAVEEVSEASGLAMEIVGRTNEAPGLNRPVEQARYGPGWAPILIAWTDPDVIPGLEGGVIGLGGPRSLINRTTGDSYYVSGQVALDSPDVKEMLADGQSDEARSVIMHELAHVLGLGHVNSPFELMYKRNLGLGQLGPGDREGLARLGRAACD